MPWYAYFLRCRDGSLYGGVTTDAGQRLAAHQAGRGARYTRARRPLSLVWVSPALAKVAAHRLEYRLKRLGRSAKLAVVSGEREPLDSLLHMVLRERSSTVRPASTSRRRKAAGSASSPATRQRRITPER